MLLYWVWFSLLTMSDRKKKELLDRMGSPDKIYESAEETDKNLEKAREILQKCREKDVKLIPFSHAAYPARLRELPDPPMLLYLKGRLPDLQAAPVIGVVGTRKCSPQGLEITERIAGQIAACGGIVATGLALGVDSAAAWGALQAGKSVIGVLGCGVDVVYPKANEALFAAVLEKGCLLSEYPPETEVRKWRFPARNRIISGISCGTLVTEAPEKSGALLTAEFAVRQGRDVFVTPGSVTEETSRGSNQLLRKGGKAVFSGWDVVSEYAEKYPVFPAEQPRETKKKEHFPTSTGKKRVKTEKTQKIIIDKDEQSSYSEPVETRPKLSESEAAVLACIPTEGRLVNEILREAGMPVGNLLVALTMLELKGCIGRLPGDRVFKKERGK